MFFVFSWKLWEARRHTLGKKNSIVAVCIIIVMVTRVQMGETKKHQNRQKTAISGRSGKKRLGVGVGRQCLSNHQKHRYFSCSYFKLWVCAFLQMISIQIQSRKADFATIKRYGIPGLVRFLEETTTVTEENLLKFFLTTQEDTSDNELQVER